MYQQVGKYFALLIIIAIGYITLMQQAIEQGRYHHAQEDYLLEASLLAYNPVIDFLGQQQSASAELQTFILLNYIQFYDLLARSEKLPTTDLLGRVLGSINDQVEIMPHEKKLQRKMIQEVVPCRLIRRRKLQLIPELATIYQAYQTDFSGLLKIQLEEKQLNAVWQQLSCSQPN